LTRVHLPGLGFAYLLLWWAVLEMLTARGSRRLAFSGLVTGMVLNLALSFNRNMWIGTALGLLLLLVVGGTVWRHRLLAAMGITAVGVVLLVAVLGGAAPSSAVDPLVQRGTTLLNPQSVGEEDSLLSRANETHFAWIAAKQHAVTGIGAGASYGVSYNQAVGAGRYKRVQQNFLHNQYLYLVLIGGVPAFVLFVAFLLAVLRRAWARPEHSHPLAALGVGLVMLMVSAVVMPYFSVPDMTAAIGLLTGVMIAWASPAPERSDVGVPRSAAAV
jgi:O-antigen ligase